MVEITSPGPLFNPNQPEMQLLFNVPVVHVTGMYNSFSNTGDLTSVLSTNMRPSVVLNMNMMVAKSYAHLLLDLVAKYEAATGVPLDTMEQLQAKFDNFQASGGKM